LELHYVESSGSGITISSNNGTISESGITIDYAYDSSTRTLQLTCTSKPFFISCGTVNGKIHELIDGSGCIGEPS
jgi:hypothetical protein